MTFATADSYQLLSTRKFHQSKSLKVSMEDSSRLPTTKEDSLIFKLVLTTSLLIGISKFPAFNSSIGVMVAVLFTLVPTEAVPLSKFALMLPTLVKDTVVNSNQFTLLPSISSDSTRVMTILVTGWTLEAVCPSEAIGPIRSEV